MLKQLSLNAIKTYFEAAAKWKWIYLANYITHALALTLSTSLSSILSFFGMLFRHFSTQFSCWLTHVNKKCAKCLRRGSYIHTYTYVYIHIYMYMTYIYICIYSVALPLSTPLASQRRAPSPSGRDFHSTTKHSKSKKNKKLKKKIVIKLALCKNGKSNQLGELRRHSCCQFLLQQYIVEEYTALLTMPTTQPPPNRRQLLRSIESLRGRVCQILNCVINLHIEFLVIEQTEKKLEKRIKYKSCHMSSA